MKSTDYLSLHEDEVTYFDIVKKSIQQLYPLRFDQLATEEYFNRYLFADARLRAGGRFVLRGDEVDPLIAFHVRVEILNVIADDPVFVYAHNIIAEGKNPYSHAPMMKLREPKSVFPEEMVALRTKIEAMCKLFEAHDHLLTDKRKKQKNMLLEMVEAVYFDAHPPNDAQCSHCAKKTTETGLSSKEICLVFYYLFDKVGLNFTNSDKTKWARFVGELTGRSAKRMRNLFNIDFDARSTRKCMKAIVPLFSELFPDIARKIENDLKSNR